MTTISSVVMNDLIDRLLDSGEVLWGDIPEVSGIAPAAAAAPYVHVHDYVACPVGPGEDDMYHLDEWDLFNTWDMPDLTLRKHIWENFPVSLLEVESADGIERYAVVWHEKNLVEWPETRAIYTADEHEFYEHFCHERLMRALSAHSHKYSIEPAHTYNFVKAQTREPRQICVIAMVSSRAAVEAPRTEAPRTEAPRAEAPRAEAPRAEAPRIEAPRAEAPRIEARKNMISVLLKYPVSWERDTRNNKIHYIQPNEQKLQQRGLTINDIAYDLRRELELCYDCIVSGPKNKGDLCTVTKQ